MVGIMQDLKKRQLMITPGAKAKFTRFMARKTTGLFHWIIDHKLAKAYAGHSSAVPLTNSNVQRA